MLWPLCKYTQSCKLNWELKSNFRSHHPLTSSRISHSGKTHLSAKRWWKKLVIKYFMSFIIAYLWRVCHSVDLSVPSFTQQPRSRSARLSGGRLISCNCSPKSAPPSRCHRGSRLLICSGGPMSATQNGKSPQQTRSVNAANYDESEFLSALLLYAVHV